MTSNLLKLQKKLLRDTLKDQRVKIQDHGEGINKIKKNTLLKKSPNCS